MKKDKLILILVFLLSFILRFYRLDKNPPGLFFDEMALGYNAYSMAQTGKDEHGRPWPLVYFASFGDYKPPGYIYAAMPLVKLLGLNEFTTRFPSAFFGFLTVVLTYFLTKEIFNKKIAILAAFILAISPWHIFLSRVAYEANVASFLVVLSVFLFLKSLKKPILLIFTSISAGLAMYTFNSSRLAVPLIFLGFVVFYFKKIFKNKYAFLASLTIALIFIMGLLPHLLSKEGKIRYHEVNIFSDLDVVKDSNRRITEDGNAIWAKIIHNRRIEYARRFLKHYFDHFSIDFLFISGDVNPRLHNQDTGQLYLIELPFLILGFYWLIKKKNKAGFIILFWLFAGLVPAAVARETPHALRAEVVLPTFQIIVAVGIYYFVMQNKKSKLKYLTIALYILSFAYFVHNYYYHYPKRFASFWHSSLKQAVQFAFENQDKYEQIIIPELGRSYIAFLFYNSFNPELFQKASKDYLQSSILSGNKFIVKKFGKYYFPDSYDKNFNFAKKSLLITTVNSVPSSATIINRFSDINKEIGFVACE